MAFITNRIGALEYLSAENISAPHCFTTRFGGVSKGHLASLNIGTHRGDDPANVLENFRILGSAVGFSPEDLVLTKQTHTDIVRVVDDTHRGTGLTKAEFPDCDGLVTNTPGVALVVFTADCTPILLQDMRTGAVGAVHAGWRGTAAGIAGKAVEAMVKNFGSRPEDIRAAIGPNISQCCFETDADVPEAMIALLGQSAQAYIRREKEKFYVNLKGINAQVLARAGVRNVELSTECTACNPQKYWSHRRVGRDRGSQGAVIVCREECR